MIRVGGGVVAVRVQGKAVFLFHAQNIVQLEEFALPLVGCRLAHADKATAVIDKGLYPGDDLLITPVGAAGLSGICVAHIQDHVKLIQEVRIALNIFKADKRHIKGCAAKRLNDAEIGIILPIIQTMVHHMVAPGAHFAPAVEHGHLLYAIGGHALNIVIQGAELVAHGLNVIHKVRELERQL